MTTPTREQVNKLLGMIQRHFPSLPLSDAYTDWKKWSEFAQAVFLFGASEARADLEATIAEQAAEIERCKQIDANVLVSLDKEINELRQQLAASQAYAEQLREAFEDCQLFIEKRFGYMNQKAQQARAALSIPHNNTTALREWGAKLVELTDEEVDSIRLSLPAVCHHKDTIRRTEKFIAGKIRKGEF